MADLFATHLPTSWGFVARLAWGFVRTAIVGTLIVFFVVNIVGPTFPEHRGDRLCWWDPAYTWPFGTKRVLCVAIEKEEP